MPALTGPLRQLGLAATLLVAAFLGGRWVESQAAAKRADSVAVQVASDARIDALTVSRQHQVEMDTARFREVVATASAARYRALARSRQVSLEDIARALPTSDACALGPAFVGLFNNTAAGNPRQPAAPAQRMDGHARPAKEPA